MRSTSSSLSMLRWMPYLNLGIILAILTCGCMIFLIPETSDAPDLIYRSSQKAELPKNPFSQPEEAYREIDEGPFALRWFPPEMQLPDLRGELIFYGQNARPDFSKEKTSFHLALRGTESMKAVHEDERIFLVYKGNYGQNILDKKHVSEPVSISHRPLWGEVPSARGGYVFSPGNQPTPLWIELKAFSSHSLQVMAHMLDEKGSFVRSSEELATFTLPAQEFPKTQTTGWELGGFRVDATLLVRQKARWMGPDRFLELHGGDDYSYAAGKERVDFMEGQTPYSCFVSANDYLIWKKERWQRPGPDESTHGLPLLVVKKIDEKIMSFELWDAEGKGKTLLNLVRIKDHSGLPNIAQEFKFVGAKTWAQFIVECRTGGRLNLKPHDWLILTQEGWKKLDSPEEIDDYVEQRLVGPLFILDKMTKQNGRQVLVGHLFNTSRTEVEDVELAAAANTSLAAIYRTMPITPPIKANKSDMEGNEE